MSVDVRLYRALRVAFLVVAIGWTVSGIVEMIANPEDSVWILACLVGTAAALVGWIVVYLLQREYVEEETARRVREAHDRLVREQFDQPWMQHRSP